MFIVENQDHVDCFKSESFNVAKQVAERMKEECGENFNIVEIKQVWTTQTLDEAMDITEKVAVDPTSNSY
jgi:hypothetical protein